MTLFVAYPKLDKLETIIQKGVELGASAIQPFTSRYCVAQPKKEEQKLERRRRIALELSLIHIFCFSAPGCCFFTSPVRPAPPREPACALPPGP